MEEIKEIERSISILQKEHANLKKKREEINEKCTEKYKEITDKKKQIKEIERKIKEKEKKDREKDRFLISSESMEAFIIDNYDELMKHLINDKSNKKMSFEEHFLNINKNNNKEIILKMLFKDISIHRLYVYTRSKKASFYEIGKELGKSKQTVYNYAKYFVPHYKTLKKIKEMLSSENNND